MKYFFIPQIPESITDITTNSSSEIFVIGKDKEIEVVEELVEANGWKWWFGDKKQFTSLEEVKNFVCDYHYVADRLFGITGLPIDREEYDYFTGNTIKPSKKIQSMRKRERVLAQQYHEYKAPDDYYFGEEKYKKETVEYAQCVEKNRLWKKYLDYSAKISKQFNIEVQEYLNTLDLSKWVGAYYFECGEDNQLDDWEKVHNTIPGNYARTG